MTYNRQQQAVVKRIAETTKRIEDELGLSGWLQIKHVYDVGMEGDTTPGDRDCNPTLHGTCAITTASWQYRMAQIRWFLPTAALVEDDMLEMIAIHEYVHILLHPVSQLVPSRERDLGPREEFATESIARVICRARGMESVS